MVVEKQNRRKVPEHKDQGPDMDSKQNQLENKIDRKKPVLP